MRSLLVAFTILIGFGSLRLAAAQITDKQFRESARALDEEVKKLDLKKNIPSLAALLKLDTGLVETNLLQKKTNFSALAIAKLVADKAGLTVPEVLDDATKPDWPETVQNAGISLAEARDYLDNLQSEVALMRLDQRLKRKK